MKRLAFFLGLAIFCSAAATQTWTQDVRSVTGLPIPIGAQVIWGQVELKGIKKGDPRPTVFVTLLVNGAQVGKSQANDQGYYYFLERKRDGAVLLVTVGGQDVGQTVITAAGGDRYDMAVDWSEANRSNAAPGVISASDLYPDRSADNKKLFVQASAAAKAKKADQAIKLYNDIVKADPKDFIAWTELGSLYFQQSKFSDAENAYNKASELKPDFLLPLLNLGKLHMANKKFDLAIVSLEKTIIVDPKSAEAHQYLGEAYLQNRQGSKAVGILNQAIALDPVGMADVHLRLAALYNAANMKDRAALEYKAFLEKKPNYAEKAQLEKHINENLK